jgi:hypothetical protein
MESTSNRYQNDDFDVESMGCVLMRAIFISVLSVKYIVLTQDDRIYDRNVYNNIQSIPVLLSSVEDC